MDYSLGLIALMSKVFDWYGKRNSLISEPSKLRNLFEHNGHISSLIENDGSNIEL